MRKYVLLWSLLLLGFVVSFIMFLSLIPGCSSGLKILFQIVSSLGGGLFASALISLLIEKGNDHLQEKVKIEQRKYFFTCIRCCLPVMLCREINTLSEYIAIDDKETLAATTSDECFPSLVSCAKSHLKRISDSVFTKSEKMLFESERDIITEKWYEDHRRKEKLFFDDMLPYYENLKKYLYNIIGDATIYLTSGWLNQSELDELQKILGYVEGLVSRCGSKRMGDVLEYKELLLDSMMKLGEISSVDMDQTYKLVQIKNIAT